MEIGNFVIDEFSPVFVIAEIGNNHNGSLELAKELVSRSSEAEANCAKFQMRHMDSLYRNIGSEQGHFNEDLGTEYTLDLLNRFQLKTEQLFELFDYTRKLGMTPLCTPWDIESFRRLEEYGMSAYKVASADFVNHELLEQLGSSGRPLICSTGMCSEDEIRNSIRLLQDLGSQFILLHCNSTYPAPLKDVHLKYLNRLRELGNCFVGYSGHERGFTIPLAAVAMGAKVIEKHLTMDRDMEGNDHRVSLLPDEFKAMVESIRAIETAFGEGSSRTLTQGELINRENLGKSIISSRSIKAGERIATDMIAIKSPGRGLAPYFKKDLIGRTAKRDLEAGEFFYLSDIDASSPQNRSYAFSRPWGLPVRYHDLEHMEKLSNPDLLEFHFSYRDLDVDPALYLKESLDLDVVVHSPELFSGDHLLDLCSEDESYRLRSIRELQKVIDVTLQLKPFFKRASAPFIIVNVGGFSLDKQRDHQERKALYDRLENSLLALCSEGVEIIPQTMPPFPWLFGGQRYHNLFIDADEIAAFCSKTSSRICLDISHSKLACTQYGWSLDAFVKKLSPFIGHLHIVDAQGVDGEGLQIGDGEVDFYSLQ
ncbi:MAG: N-acetylneuraminate synthase family protein, partial [Planctomycetes bacterium]|nr:N-acetylneuraminate synthase family protein [Planctomycetota bacterium]